MNAPPAVVTSFRALARLSLRHARTAKTANRPNALAYHLTEALAWRRYANRLRTTMEGTSSTSHFSLLTRH